MFWEYGLTVSNMDQLLERDPPATIEEILGEPNILQEIKTNNERLIAFITDPPNLSKIFDLLISESLDVISRVSKEILILGVHFIDDSVFEERNNIYKIFGLFRSKSPSFVGLRRAVAVLEHQAHNRAAELFSCFREAEKVTLNDLISIIRYQPVAELLVKLVTCHSEEMPRKNSFARLFMDTNCSNNLICKIVGDELETAKGSLYVLTELMRWVRYELPNVEIDGIEWEIFQSFQKEENIEILIKSIIKDKEYRWPALAVLCLIFDLQRTGDTNGDEFISPSNIPILPMNLSKKTFSNIIPYLEPILLLLKETKLTKNKMGKYRILIIELLVSLALYNNEDLSREIFKLEIPLYLINLFEEFPEINIVHNLIEMCITSILMGYRWKTYNGAHLYIDNNLILSLFKNEDFIQKLILLSSSTKNFIGHIRQIQRTYRLALLESYHKTILNEITDGFSTKLKESLKCAEEELSRLDYIEAIDTRFLKVMTDDFDSPSFIQDSSILNITLEKSIEYFKNEKNILFPDDIAENFENQMIIDVNTSGIGDKFEDMKIPKISLDINYDLMNSLKSKINEIAKYKINIDDSSTNDLENDKSKSFSMSRDEELKIVLDNIQDVKNHSNNENITDSQYASSFLNPNHEREATSSPLVGAFNKLSIEENIFDDDSS